MRIFIPRELHPGEKRVPIVPNTAEKLVKSGAEVVIESGMGKPSRHTNSAYEEAGATITLDRNAALADADMVLRLRTPPVEEIARLKKGCIHIVSSIPLTKT